MLKDIFNFPYISFSTLPGSIMDPITHTLAKTLQCDAMSLTTATLSGQFLTSGHGMPRMRSYIKCLRRTSGLQKYAACATVLRTTCLNSTIVAAKVIRYPMYEVPKLLKMHPSLKVIHYIRDPRGTIVSRSMIHGWSGSTLVKQAKHLCMKMANNHKVFTDLHRINPDNFLLLKYEDLALKPEEISRELYSFIGHKYPDYIRRWVAANTTAAHSNSAYDTHRNATYTVKRGGDTAS